MRTVVVTGGAYGIGRAIVRRFAAEQHAVVISDPKAQRGQELASEAPNTAFHQTDVREEDQIRNLVAFTNDRFGRIDVICSNAGVERYKRADQYTSDDWSEITDTNFRAAFLIAKYAFPSLRETRGCIVFTSSVQAIATEKDVSIYAASKSGLLGLMRGMAVDFAPAGVRVNAVCPGATMTGMMEAAVSSEPDPEATLKSVAASIPLNRIGSSEDVAHAVFFLAYEQASYSTEPHLVVDGGMLARIAL